MLVARRGNKIRGFLAQLSEPDYDFMIEQNNHEAQTKNRTKTVDENNTSKNTNDLAQISDSKVDVHTLAKSIANKMDNEVDSVMTTV